MPSIPQDMDKARAKAAKDIADRQARQAKAEASAAHDKAVIRDFANELRAKVGEPPLREDEPVIGFFCRRGRKP